MNEPVDLIDQPEEVRVALYGALFALAAADGTIDKTEVSSIFESLDVDGLSETAKRKIHDYMIDPPPIDTCLSILKSSSGETRYGLMLNLLEVAHSDDYLDDAESALIERVKRELDISSDQMRAMEIFVKEAKRIKERGLDDNTAVDAMKSAAAGLTGVGIPIAAVYFSGSVIGLSAAGITSGLAALGLGFGMVPGIGTAILIGTVIVLGVGKLLDIGGKRKKEALAAERERKAELVIKNLQEAINFVILKLDDLKNSALDAQANREAIAKLTQRLKALKAAVNAREAAMEAV